VKRDYKLDAKIGIYAMNIRYQIHLFGGHPWIKETIIPRTDFEKQLFNEVHSNIKYWYR